MFEVPAIADLNLGVALPALFLVFTACVLLVVDLFIPKEKKTQIE